MTQKLLDRFRTCKPGQTYYVEGLDKDKISFYWYFFECVEVRDDNIIGNDIYDWEDTKTQEWTMDLKDNDIEIETGVKKMIKMSKKKFIDLYPEHVL